MEKVEPKTVKEMVKAHMIDMLKNAGNARSRSIKLSLTPCGKDLGDELLEYAVAVETLLKQLQQGITDDDQKKLGQLPEDAKKKDALGLWGLH